MQGQSTQPVKVRSKEVSVHLGSYPGDGRVTRPAKPRGQRPAFQGGSASVRAATRVKPEQASKGVMRAPSLLIEDEGRRGRPDAPTCDGRPARRGSRRSTYAYAMTGNTGDLFEPRPARARTLHQEAGSAGVAGAHTTHEAGQCRRRKGALVRGVLERAERGRLA